jgi:hypothetical protein
MAVGEPAIAAAAELRELAQLYADAGVIAGRIAKLRGVDGPVAENATAFLSSIAAACSEIAPAVRRLLPILEKYERECVAASAGAAHDDRQA